MQTFEFIKRVVLAGALLFAGFNAGAAELLMVEQNDCPYCKKFLAEIAPIYPKTDEGKRAPLRRADLSDPLAEEFELLKPVVHTPTFILIKNKKEVDRLEGYQGDDYFWFLLGEMLEKLDQ